jgi:hypothetical protein
MDGERNLSVPKSQQLAHMHPFISEAVACLASLVRKTRGVAAESTTFRDRKGNQGAFSATPHPLGVLL